MDLELNLCLQVKYTLFRQNNAVISPEILEDLLAPLYLNEKQEDLNFHVSGFLNEAEMAEIKNH